VVVIEPRPYGKTRCSVKPAGRVAIARYEHHPFLQTKPHFGEMDAIRSASSFPIDCGSMPTSMTRQQVSCFPLTRAGVLHVFPGLAGQVERGGRDQDPIGPRPWNLIRRHTICFCHCRFHATSDQGERKHQGNGRYWFMALAILAYSKELNAKWP